jgi:chemotaxis response regulator CheB
MKIEIDLELLSLIDRRVITLSQLPRKKKKRLKKELASIVIQLANKEANQLFHNHIQDTYKDLIEELQAIEAQISSIPGDHSAINH